MGIMGKVGVHLDYKFGLIFFRERAKFCKHLYIRFSDTFFAGAMNNTERKCFRKFVCQLTGAIRGVVVNDKYVNFRHSIQVRLGVHNLEYGLRETLQILNLIVSRDYDQELQGAPFLNLVVAAKQPVY